MMREAAARCALAGLAVAAVVAACGGGGSDNGAASGGAGASTSEYPHSVAPGASAPFAITYRAAAANTAATVTTSVASALLPVGTTPLLAEYTDPRLPGLRVACISGSGDSTNVITGIDLGVIAESAAVLLDARWSAVDAAAAWAAAVASGAAWSGWENCGVKPEGVPSPSSRLVPDPGGGYVEDVYDGNPGTTFNVIRRQVTASDVAALLAASGSLTTEDPLRPLRLTLRAYADGAGHTVFVESGVATPGAPPTARGFIALYVPA